MFKQNNITRSLVLSFLIFSMTALQAYAEPVKSDNESVSGPIQGMKVTEEYVRMAARDMYFWGWPMANIYARRLAFQELTEPSLMGGIAPVAPLNHLSMLTDYIDPSERMVACPNQDVVYGSALLALDLEPAVVQVPDFGERFWVYQVVDLRTDGFAALGAMYGTKPGFYLLAGPDWDGDVPAGITQVFRASSNTGMVIPRVFQSDMPEDKLAVQAVIKSIDVYPLSEFDGTMKTNDWSAQPTIQGAQQSGEQEGETKWVNPNTFFDLLPTLLADAKPLPGEDARYVHAAWLADLAKNDSAMRDVMVDEATKAEEELIAPLLQLRSFGLALPHNWGTITNGADFGIDYFTRTAVARSNILVNKAAETKYFYQDLDDSGQRLDGDQNYTITFPAGGVPANGFWSLTLYNEQHFFAPNELNRYSIGTKSQNLVYNADGSLTLYVQSDNPGQDLEANWLPSPDGEPFSLYIRAYWPTEEVLNGDWTPPAVTVAQ